MTYANRTDTMERAPIRTVATISTRRKGSGVVRIAEQNDSRSMFATRRGSTVTASRPTRYDWTRAKHLVKERAGVHAWRIIYFCRIDAYTILNVWRDGGTWKYVVIATHPTLILAKGIGPTMHETKLRAEAAFGDDQPQRSTWNRTDNDAEPDSKLPF